VKLCPQCGHRLQEGFQICPFDGTEVVDAARATEKSNWSEAAKPSQPPVTRGLSSNRLRRTTHATFGQKYGPSLISCAVVLVLVAAGAFFFFKSNDEPSKTVPTLQEMAQGSDVPGAIAILERRKKDGTMISKEHELLNKLYLQQATTLKNQGQTDSSIELLKKVPTQSEVYSQSVKLANQLKKKH
jgi:hypothetical protein